MRAGLSEELRLLDDMARDFALKELVEEREERDHFPFGPPFADVLARAKEVGFFSILLPEEMGGAAEPVQALCLVLEEVCREDASLGGAVFTVALAQELMAQAGAAEKLKELGADSDSLEETLLAFPSFHNPGDIPPRLIATPGKEAPLLTGTIEYVVLGNLASRALLPAETEGGEGYSFFLVDLKDRGVTVGDPVLGLGMHACPVVDISLGAAPGELLGEEGRGALYFEAAVDRLSAAAAISCGIMKGSFETALDYARQRMQGGREIVNWSEVRMMLSSMAVRSKVAEMLVQRAARAVDGEEPGWGLASRAAALQVQETAAEVTCDGIQLLGGYGYMQDYGQEKRFRDAQQAQALLGMAPVRGLRYIRRIVDGEPPW